MINLQDFVTSKGTNALQIYEYKCLWLQLNRLTRDVGNVFCLTFGYLCTTWVLYVLFCLYLFIDVMSTNNKIDHTLVNVLIIWTVLHCFCSYAGNATNSVSLKHFIMLHAFWDNMFLCWSLKDHFNLRFKLLPFKKDSFWIS